MQTVSLPGSGRLTTRIGFGCSGVLGGPGARHSLRLLEAAYDAGIRHFDVAPMYGYGTAEPLLGSFLQRHADATVTTKYGLLAERRSNAQILVRSVAKQVLSRLRRSRPAAAPSAVPAAQPGNKAPFDAQAAEQSMHRSLRALQRDHIDLFLLHEASADDLLRDDLLNFLEGAKRAGHIGAFGVGSTSNLVPELIRSHPEYCCVVQSEWTVSDEALDTRERFRVAHRVLQSAAVVRQWLHSNPAKQGEGERSIAAALQDETVWPGLLLQTALTVNPGSLVLFSSRSAERIRANTEAASRTNLAHIGISLHKRLLREMHQNDANSYNLQPASVVDEPNRG